MAEDLVDAIERFIEAKMLHARLKIRRACMLWIQPGALLLKSLAYRGRPRDGTDINEAPDR
jgi:hypothetical protein